MDKYQLMTSGEAARRLGLSDERVRQLDAELRPARTVRGQRIYSTASVERLAARRDAKERAR